MANILSPAPPPTAEGTPASEPVAFPTAGQLMALFAGYFALQVVIRVLLSPSVDLDESEQVILSQKFSLGYGSDPPVYTWIQMGFFALFGRGVLALALLKDLLLFATYWLVYANARFITRSHLCGAAAALSLLFIPHVVWEAQRDLTHTILASTCAAGALLCLLQAHERRSTSWYLAFGAFVGFGVLAKYNFAFWPLGLLAAGLSLRQFRPTLLNWRMGLALTVALLIVLPNALWVVGHPQLALRTSGKLGVEGSSQWLKVVWTGLRHAVQAIAAFAGPVTGLCLLLALPPRQANASSRPGADYAKLLWRAWAVILGAVVLVVLVFRATGFRERWFLPLLVCAPVLGITLARGRINLTRVRWLLGAGLLVMLGVSIINPARIVWAERLKRTNEPLTWPAAELARQIEPELPPGTLLVADNSHNAVLAGNLKLSLPRVCVATPDLADLLDPDAAHCVLVWDATEREAPPKGLLVWAQARSKADLAGQPPRYFSATYRFFRQKQWRLGLLPVY